MRTARKYIESALRLINALNVGEAPDNEESNDALDVFNDMLSAWSLERLLLPYTASKEFLTIPGQKVYSVGPGGEWDTVRPQKIRNGFLRIGGSLDLPMTQLERDQYAAVPNKGTPSPQPTSYYYEAQFPLGFISLYPVPSVEVGIVLVYDAALSNNMTLDTDLSALPPGYELAIRYNLAVLLAPEYSRPVSNDIARKAEGFKGNIKSNNSVSMDAVIDDRLPGTYRGGWDYRVG